MAKPFKKLREKMSEKAQKKSHKKAKKLLKEVNVLQIKERAGEVNDAENVMAGL